MWLAIRASRLLRDRCIWRENEAAGPESSMAPCTLPKVRAGGSPEGWKQGETTEDDT
ncbi:hypothetical protein B0H12DRAFT_1083539 [Mycena haematopus]|nr:hypothetical protein B0H12DRAFT_1083539 [Mycena haematopus]